MGLTLSRLIIRACTWMTLRQTIYMASKRLDMDEDNESWLGVKVRNEQCEETTSSTTLHMGSSNPVKSLNLSPRGNGPAEAKKRSAPPDTESLQSPKRRKIHTVEFDRAMNDKNKTQFTNNTIECKNKDDMTITDARQHAHDDNAKSDSNVMDRGNVTIMEEHNHALADKKDTKMSYIQGTSTIKPEAEPKKALSALADIKAKTSLRASEKGDLQEQIYATLYGQCIGDAIGLLTEFMSKENAHHYYGHKTELEYTDKIRDRHRKRWEVGDWTDDSDQMILIMQSLINEKGEVNPNDFARRLVKWMEEGFHELGDYGGLGIGHTTYITITREGFEANAHTISKDVWEDSGRFLAPNGGVMRTSILGIHEWWDTEKVYRNAIDICKTTHFDPRCQASAVSVCVAISLMLQRKDRHYKNGEYIIQTIIEDVFLEASTCFKGAVEKKELQRYLQCKDLYELQLDEVSSIGYTYKCLGAGFWALKQTDFRKALQEITMSGGDADTNGAVAGALLGCKLGNRKCFPESWLQLKHREWLDRLIQKYLKVLTKQQEEWNVFKKNGTNP